MIDEKYIHLIQKDLDQEISKREKKKLLDYIETNSEAEKLYSELKATVRMLAQADEFDPPQDIKENVLNKIDLYKYNHKPAQETIFESLKSFFGEIRFKYAYSFTVGIVTGLIIFSLISNNYIDKINSNHLSGAILSKSYLENFNRTDYLEINEADFKGTFEIKASDKIIFIDCSIISNKSVEIIFSNNGQSLNLSSYSSFDNGNINILNERGQIKIDHVGTVNYLIAISNPTGSVSDILMKIKTADFLKESVVKVK